MKDLEVKKQVVDMLRNFIMGETGSKFKPKSLSVSVIKPVEEDKEEEDEYKEEEGDNDLDKAIEEHETSDEQQDRATMREVMGEKPKKKVDMFGDEEEENPKKKTLREFFGRG